MKPLLALLLPQLACRPRVLVGLPLCPAPRSPSPGLRNTELKILHQTSELAIILLACLEVERVEIGRSLEVWLFVGNGVVARRRLVVLGRGKVPVLSRIVAGDGEGDGDAEDSRVGVVRDVEMVRAGE